MEIRQLKYYASKLLAKIIRRLRYYVGEVTAFTKAVWENGSQAKSRSGKSISSQCWEILTLRHGIGKLDPDEYYQYGLFDDARFSVDDKSRYLGRCMGDHLVYVLNATLWSGMANDKLITQMLLEKGSFPVPKAYAVYDPFRSGGDIPVVRSLDALISLLASDDSLLPAVIKPNWGIRGEHILSITKVSFADNQVCLSSGKILTIQEFTSRLSEAANFRTLTGVGGLLVQERINPHDDVKTYCGDRLCTLRIVLILDQGNPKLIASLIRIPVADNTADNYWEPGNLVARVDPATGTVGAPMTGLGLALKHVTVHPDTKMKLEGWKLPDWHRHLETCKEAALLFPGIPMQAWDVAISDRGPVLIELNVNGGMRLPQLTEGQGIYQGEFKRWLDAYGFRS